MKTLGIMSTAIVSLLLAGGVTAYSQDRDESKPAQTQEEKDKAKNNDKARQNEKAPRPDDRATRPDDRRQPEARPQEQREQRTEQREQRSDQRMDQNRQNHRAAAHQGKHIDDDKFRASFGRQHNFKVQRTQVVNDPQPVVVYGGYSFQLVDAWPQEWSFDDDVYVDYIDGEYFLVNAYHPEMRVAVFVVE